MRQLINFDLRIFNAKRFKRRWFICLLIFANLKCYSQIDTIVYSSKTQIWEKGKMYLGKRIGEWTAYSTDSIVIKKMTYLQNNKVAVTEYYRGQNPREKYTCFQVSDSNCVLYGHYISFYENGKIGQEGYYDSNGKGKGEWKFFYESGQLSRRMYFSNGKLNRDFKSYYSNGSLKENGKYKEDNRFGRWFEYYENGRVKSIGSYIPETKIINYSEETVDSLKLNGYDTNYLNFPMRIFLKRGEWKYWNERGDLIMEEKYSDGKRIRKLSY